MLASSRKMGKIKKKKMRSYIKERKYECSKRGKYKYKNR